MTPHTPHRHWCPLLIAEAIVGWGCIGALVAIVRAVAEIVAP